MPYAGYRRAGGVAPTQDQGNPFYDPYSPTPNYGAGIQSFIQNLWQMDALKKQQEAEAAQLAFENQMKMGDFDLQRAQADAYRRKDVTPDEPEYMKQARAYSANMGVPLSEAIKMFAPVQKTNAPTETTYDKQLSAAREALGSRRISQAQFDAIQMGIPDPMTPEKAGATELAGYDKEVTADLSSVKNAINKYDTKIQQIDTLVTKTEGQLALAEAAADDKQAAFYQSRITQATREKDNLLQVKEHLGSLSEQLGMGQRLSSKQRAGLMAVNAGVDVAKQNPTFFRSQDYKQSATALNGATAVSPGATPTSDSSSPPAPAAGTAPGTRRQNKRTGEWWSWSGSAWNKVG